jgi:hypothetical protein
LDELVVVPGSVQVTLKTDSLESQLETRYVTSALD